MSGNGAASPGRWHGVQLEKTIGATCSLKVTGACALGCTAPRPSSTAPARRAPRINVAGRYAIACTSYGKSTAIPETYTPRVSPRFDVVGIGENSVDLVYRMPAAPAPDSKVAASAYRV